MVISNLLNSIVTFESSFKTYKYPHDYPNSWVEQQYLPDNIKNKKYYTPKHNKYEDNLYYGHENMKKPN